MAQPVDPERRRQVVAYAEVHGNAAAIKKFGIHRSTLFAYKHREAEINGNATRPKAKTHASALLGKMQVPAAEPQAMPLSDLDELIQWLEEEHRIVGKKLEDAKSIRELIRARKTGKMGKAKAPVAKTNRIE